MRLFPRIAFALGLAVCPATLAGQVGYPPTKSPYHEVLPSRSWIFNFGYFGGSGGDFGVGPHDGLTYGVDWNIRVSTPLQLGVTFTYGALERMIVHPADSLQYRYTGPVGTDTYMLGASGIFNITGKKTWHGFAPYAFITLGVVNASSTPDDNSGYEFGTKLYGSPGLGFRYYLRDRLYFRGQTQYTIWGLTYPPSYILIPIQDPTAPPVINNGDLSTYTGSLQVQVSVAYSFSFF